MSLTVPASDPTLDFLGLFADQTEDVILARWRDWANEGLDPVADAESWVDTREGSHWYTSNIQAVQEAARLYDLMGTEVPMSAFVLWAWGEYLDDLAAVFDVERLAASYAVGVVSFSGPAGVQITQGVGVGVPPLGPDDPAPTFTVAQTVVIPDGGSGTGSVDVAITASDAGSLGDVAAGAITAVISPIVLPSGTSLTVTNADPTGGGEDAETDDQLRTRVLQATAGKGPGNVADLLRWAMAWPGVGSARVVPTWNGPNSALIAIGDQNGQPLPDPIRAALQADLDPVPGQGAGTAPVGQQVTVVTPTSLTANVSATVTYASGYSADGSGGTVALRPDITARIVAYYKTCQPGGFVSLAHVAGIIATTTGIVDVTNAKINNSAANLALGLSPAQVPILRTLSI